MAFSDLTFRHASPADYEQIRRFLLESVSLYPAIDGWWCRRVMPGIATGERTCHVAATDDSIVGLCIGRISKESSKLCTLRVREEHRASRIGQTLLHRALKDMLKAHCKAVHYTISEKILCECGSFYEQYGFRMVSWQPGRYTKGMDELVFSVSSEEVRRSLREKLPPVRKPTVVVLSIKPQYASLIEDGIKQVEFRRRFPRKYVHARAVFYVTSPVKELRLGATIADVVESSPYSLWDEFGHAGGIERDAFDDYFSGASKGYALILSDVEALGRPIPLALAKSQCPSFTPPQSFCTLPRDSFIGEYLNPHV